MYLLGECEAPWGTSLKCVFWNRGLLCCMLGNLSDGISTSRDVGKREKASKVTFIGKYYLQFVYQHFLASSYAPYKQRPALCYAMYIIISSYLWSHDQSQQRHATIKSVSHLHSQLARDIQGNCNPSVLTCLKYAAL